MVLEPLIRNAETAPQRVAVIDDHGSYTAGQLWHATRQLMVDISAATQKNTVGILLPASAGFVTAFYATLAAGKVAVPINFLLGPREIGHIIQDSGIDTIITAPPLAAKLEGMPINVLDLSKLDPQRPPAAAEPARAAAGDLALLLYTSGTSGLPKGVRLTHGNLHEDVRSCIEHADLLPEHRFLGIVPLFHSTGMLATMLVPMGLGATMVYVARFSPVATIKAVRQHAISVLVGVPSMYGAVLRLKDAGPEDFAQLFVAISGGEPLPSTIREAFKARFNKPIHEGYGLTETIGPVCFNHPHAAEAGSVGRPIPRAEIRIEGDDGQPLGPNQTGEVLLRGPMIMEGYHNLPAETAAAITPEKFFRTGDLGHIDDNGYLHITGRKKDLIIVSGEKVYPREVEELLITHEAIAEAAVVSRPDESRGEAVVAFVVAKPEQTVTVESVKKFCRDAGMIGWKIPKDVYVVEDLPRSPTGKVLKRELAAKVREGL